jgi:hypothetical protein
MSVCQLCLITANIKRINFLQTALQPNWFIVKDKHNGVRLALKEYMHLYSQNRTIPSTSHTGLFKVNLEFSFSIPGLFQTWNSNKPGFEKLNSRSEPGFDNLNSRSEPGFEKLNFRSEPGFENLKLDQISQ